jgi:hypothetical protein
MQKNKLREPLAAHPLPDDFAERHVTTRHGQDG